MTNTNERTFTVHFIEEIGGEEYTETFTMPAMATDEEIESEAYSRVPSGFYYLCHGERK